MVSLSVSDSASWLARKASCGSVVQSVTARGSLGMIWDPAESDGTEITGSTGVTKVGRKKAYAHSALCHRGRHAALSVGTLLKHSGLSLRGKREHL